MIAMVVTLKVKDGKQADFEAVARDLIPQVRANEPGNAQYMLCKKSPTEYVFIEQYKDDAAIAAHRDSTHFKTLSPKLGECLDGRPDILRLDVVL